MKNVLQNLASVIGGEAIVRVANLVATLAIARLYGPAILGLYGACLALVTTVSMFADNGLQLSAVTEITSAPKESSRVAGELYLAKTLLSTLVIIFLLALGLYRHFPPIYWIIGALVTLRTLIQSASQLQIAILKSQFKMHFIGIVQSLHAAFLFVGTAVAFFYHWPVTPFLWVLVVGQFLEFALMSVAVLHSRIFPRWPLISSCLALLRRSVPLGLAYALESLMIRFDVVVLSLLVSLPEIGQFAAADNLLVIFYVASWLFGSVLLPELVQHASSPTKLADFQNHWIRFTSLLMIPAALLGFLLTPKIVVALYGASFSQAGAMGSWLALAAPFIVWNSLFLHFAIAAGAKRTYLTVLFAASLFAVTLNFLLARRFGPFGIVAAILIREALMTIAFCALHFHARRKSAEFAVSASSE